MECVGRLLGRMFEGGRELVVATNSNGGGDGYLIIPQRTLGILLFPSFIRSFAGTLMIIVFYLCCRLVTW